MKAGLLMLGVVVAGVAGTGLARAQDGGRGAALAGVARACKAETQRFCPALAGSTPQPRNVAICLKPYKSSLSLGCRRAVMAVYP